MNSHRTAYFVLLATLAVAAAWLLAAKFVATPLLASAYRGESLPFLNGMISGQDVHPLEFYLDDWQRVSRKVCVLIVAIGAASIVLLHPKFQEFVDYKWPVRAVNRDHMKPMAGYRVWLANLTIICIVGLSGYAIARPVELWPFSPYPMYAGITRGDTVEYLRLYGVDYSTDLGEFPLIHEDYIYPFDDGKFNDMIQILLRQKDQQRITNVLRDTLSRYEERRQSGEHDGPPLTVLRLYRVKWSLDPWATNRDQPDEKNLIAEVRL